MKVIVPDKFVERLEKLSVGMADSPLFPESHYSKGGVVRLAMMEGLKALEETAYTDCVNVMLVDYGPRKINCIKAIRALTGLGLKEAKYVSENTPIAVREGLSLREANAVKKELEATGASVEIVPG